MPNQLKIAIVVGTFPVVSQTFIVNQINALIDAGYDITLFSYKKGSKDVVHNMVFKHQLQNKVIYFKKSPKNILKRYVALFVWTIKHLSQIDWYLYFKALNSFKYGKLAWSLGLFSSAQWFLLKKHRFDIVHINFGHYARGVSNIKALGFLGNKTKVVTTFHGYDLMPNKHGFYKNANANILQETDCFTVNSLYLKAQLLKLNPDLTPVYVLPVGLDTQFFKCTQEKRVSNNFDIVFCGRLIALKGLELAIDIIKTLVDKNYLQVRFFIIGEGPLGHSIQDKITHLNLENHVFLKGALNQQQIKEVFEQCDMFLLPGIADPDTGQQESQGLVIQEAQAMELPVVVSDVGGMKYGMIPDETGFVVAENDINGFVNAIETLITNDALKETMGQQGRAFVCNYYDTKILQGKLADIYHKVIAQ